MLKLPYDVDQRHPRKTKKFNRERWVVERDRKVVLMNDDSITSWSSDEIYALQMSLWRGVGQPNHSLDVQLDPDIED